MSREISIGTILHLVGMLIAAVSFWFALSGRLDVFQARLESNTDKINAIQHQVDRIEDRVTGPGFKPTQ